MIMNSCPECGYPLSGNERVCPECGSLLIKVNVNPASDSIVSKQDNPNDKDWANYIYECGVIFWKVFTKHYATSHGRASRREFWSFSILAAIFSTTIITFLILIIPWICVCIRRMHDINKCGWWSCVPIACFFLYLKKSDEGYNRYGNPEPAKNLL